MIFFSLLRKNHRLLDIWSVSGVITLYIFCMVRMFIPIEVPWVTVIFSEHVFNMLHRLLYADVILVGYGRIEVWRLLFFIWAFVSMILFIRLIFSYLRMNYHISNLPCTKSKTLNTILEQIENSENHSLKAEVIRSSGIDEPLGVGILHKKILIPDIEYSTKNLFYIIRHEYMHLKNQDLLVQLLINLLCTIYWWNPFIYFLRKDLEHSFEIRCDQMVVRGMNDDEIADYLDTLLTVFREKKMRKKDFRNVVSMLGIERSHRDDMKERFDLLIEESSPAFKTYGRIAAIIAMLFFLGLSYSFILQPKFLPQDEDIITLPDSYEVETDESYIIHYADDTYVLVTSEGDRIDIDSSMAQTMINDGFQVKEALE